MRLYPIPTRLEKTSRKIQLTYQYTETQDSVQFRAAAAQVRRRKWTLVRVRFGADYNGNIRETASLASFILNYKYENGRTYHSFRDGQYIIPNDDKEQVDLSHY